MQKVKSSIKMLSEKPDVQKDEFGLDIAEMAKAGLHFGQRTSKTHPKMLPYVFGVRNAIHVIDLEKTLPVFREALQFIRSLAADKKKILFVGTKIQHKDAVRKTAEACEMPYVTERWLGGTFTNFGIMAKRIEHLKELEQKKAEGALAQYTKKERARIDEEMERLDKKFHGIKNIEKLPDAIFVCDINKEAGAIKEARMKGIPVIGICDTNADPTRVNFAIPANDDAISSVRYILDKIRETILGATKND
ncbi:MAG: 30S ribosomal protein S2 [Parcubacteria group bacterium GW2011_GWA2_47_9]|nr:MAG: 30S ribosomal protein S2 [Parcubacteria group bacterium GW2011_GWA2_47_9]